MAGKFGTFYTLACRCLRICYSLTKLHNELVCLKEIFLKNSYPEDFINKCFENFIDDIHIVKKTTLTTEKKPLSYSFHTLVQYSYKLGLS